MSANENFIVKNGLSVGGNTVITSAGLLTGPAGSQLQAAFDTANSAYTTANSPTDAWVRGQANSAYTQANTATTNAATADQRAVTSGSYANSSYSQANTATTNAATADQRAVTSGSYANSAYSQANTAIVNAAAASSYSNSAYTQANTATTNAATADQKAVSAGVYANAAFSASNTANTWLQSYVNTQVSALVASAPTTLDTLNELAIALGNDANFSTTIATTIGTAGSYANSAFSKANTATTNAATADQRAVTSGNYANSAYAQANTATTNAATADQRAVTSGSYANSAYAKANTGITGITITDDNSTYGSFYPLFTTATSGSITSEKVSSSKIYWNPSQTAFNITDGTYSLSLTPQSLTLGNIIQSDSATIFLKTTTGLSGGAGAIQNINRTGLWANTTDATPYCTTISGNLANTSMTTGDQVQVSNGEVAIVTAFVTAQSQGTAGSNLFDGTKTWKMDVSVIKNNGVITLDYLSTAVSNTGNSSSWTANVISTIASGMTGLSVEVVGESSKNIFWTATIDKKGNYNPMPAGGGGGGR